MTMLRRWLYQPTDAASSRDTDDLGAEYKRIFGQLGRSEFERVLLYRHADAAAAFATETLAKFDQLRAEAETQAEARATAEAEAARCQAVAAAETTARIAAEAEAVAQAEARATAEAEAARCQIVAAAETAARIAAEAETQAEVAARVTAALAPIRTENALLSEARAAAEHGRNLALAEAGQLKAELVRLRAEAGFVQQEAAPQILASREPPIPFDEQWYLTAYGDVRAAVAAEIFSSGLDHYLQHGRFEGRQPLP